MTRAREIANVLGRNIESTTFTATAGQTAFSITHTQNRIQVFLNGLLLDQTNDWTSDGSTVTLTEGAVAGDELEVVKYDNLAIADVIPSSGGTFNGNVTLASGNSLDLSAGSLVMPNGDQHMLSRHINKAGANVINASTTYADVGCSITLTPHSTSSQMLIFFKFGLYWSPNGDAKGRILRDSTTIYENDRIAGNATTQHEGHTDFHIDHPNTTSSVTYKMQGGRTGSGGQPDFNHAGNKCHMLILELAE